MDTMELYRQAQDTFDAVLAKVGPDQWDQPSTCTEWSVRDLAGHVIWAQRQLRAWATGDEYTETGGPGTPHPIALAAGDPVTTWREARKSSMATLTPETLAMTVSLAGLGDVPLIGIVSLLITDSAVHAWDIGHSLGMDVRLAPELVSASSEWARARVARGPGFFGPELTPPDDADEQTRMLAFVGRAAWQPVAA